MRFLPLVLWLTLAGICGAADEYLPIAVGNEWTMDATVTSPDGEVAKASGHRKTGGTEERDGKTYYRTATVMEGGPFPMSYTKLYRKDVTGMYVLDPRDKEPKEQAEVLLPFKAGRTWERMSETMVLTVTEIGVEPVTVNGKTYENCYHIRVASKDGVYVEDYWEAPKVGCIKSEIVLGGGKILLTLREFKPGK